MWLEVIVVLLLAVAAERAYSRWCWPLHEDDDAR